MTIIVCGSRVFDDHEFLFRKLDSLTRKLDKKKLTVCTGAQRSKAKDGHWHGADFFAERWAAKNWCNLLRFHANWDKHGKSAGMIRNSEMLKESKATVLIAFRVDGDSPGTDDMVAKARKKKLTVKLIRCKARGNSCKSVNGKMMTSTNQPKKKST